MKKKVLLLNAYFKPEIQPGSLYAEALCQELANRGIEMQMYVPMPTRGVDDSTRVYYKKHKDEILYNGFLKVHRFSMIREGKNPVCRAIRYFLCNIIQLYFGLRAHGVDVIFVNSTPPTLGIIAVLLKKIKQVRFIYNLQDIFPESMVNAGYTKKRSLVWRIGSFMQQTIYSNADTIIVISNEFKNYLLRKKVEENKIAIVPNGVDTTKIYYIKRENNYLFHKYNLNPKKFYVTYCGNIGASQNFQLLLHVAKKIENIDEICFVIIGEGVYKNNVKKMISELNIKNVKLLPFQKEKCIKEVFSLGDVGLVISKSGNAENSLPSKTWNIMATGRPVIASYDDNSALVKLLKSKRLGLTSAPDDVEGLYRNILLLYHNSELKNDLGNAALKYVKDNLQLTDMIHQYTDIILKET